MTTFAYARVKTSSMQSKDALKHSETQGQYLVEKPVSHNSQSTLFCFARIGIQPKMKINSLGDDYEQEADRVAEWVMKNSRSSDSGAPVATAKDDEGINRKCAACKMKEKEEEEKQLNLSQKTSSATSNLEASDEEIMNYIDKIHFSGGGSSLDPSTKEFMESRFGFDFSKVRIHTDDTAARSANSVNALAYTSGNDIVFVEGEYRPDTIKGRRLLAHELTHVVQHTQRLGQTGPYDVNKYKKYRIMRQEDENSLGFFGTIASGVETIFGGVMGEFHEDPTFAMIGVDLGVSLVPILDQASDVRDIVAHLYYMIYEGESSHFMRWVGLVFTLIGLIPEVGSVIKSASKFIIKGISEVVSHLYEIFALFKRIAPIMTTDVRLLQMYITRNWNSFVGLARRSWDDVIGKVSYAASLVSSEISDIVRRIREMAPEMIASAFEWIRLQWNRVLDSLGERLGRRERILWSTWEDYPKVILPHPRTGAMTEYAQVGDRLYTQHAVNRMYPSGRHTSITQPLPESPVSVSHESAIYVGGSLDYGRSVSPNFIEDVIRTGSSRIEVKDGIARTIFTSGTVEVVTEQGGRIVITVITR